MTLPVGATGRCDVVVPDGPDGAVLLTAAGRHHGWPTVLQHSTPERLVPPVADVAPDVRHRLPPARSSFYDLPYRFDVFGGWKGYTVRIAQRGDGWAALRHRP